MTYLYGGSVLRVDLTTGRWHAVPTERYAREYVGGRGLCAGLLFESDAARGKARSGGVACCLSAGALAGSFYPGCGDAHVLWTSPASAAVGSARVPGGWAAELKQAGWDAVVLEGRADRPVYLCVRNETVELRPAREVWGASCGEAEDLMRAQSDSPDAQVISAGPAGEKQEACAALHGDVGLAEGDPGSGAAFGAMNCKAVVVRGTRGVRLADPAALLDIALAAHEEVKTSAYGRRVHASEAPDLPRAWRRRRAGCAGCPVSCRDSYEVSGRGGALLPREARTGLWPELRRRDAGLWFELARRCEQAGVDAWSTTEESALGGVGAREAGATTRRLGALTAAAAGAERGVAAAVAALVGACDRLAGAEDDPLGPGGFAAAHAAGLGRPVGADELVRAAERTRRLEGVLARNVRAAAAATAPRLPRARASAAGREVPLVR